MHSIYSHGLEPEIHHMNDLIIMLRKLSFNTKGHPIQSQIIKIPKSFGTEAFYSAILSA